jgi:hypothetical protein
MHAHPVAQAPARSTAAAASVAGALRVVEALLLRGGQRTARRNAWSAVLEDRRRAKDRSEAQLVLDTLSAPSIEGGTGATLAAVRPRGAGEL